MWQKKKSRIGFIGLDFFAMDGSESILDEKHLGIVNGLVTVGVTFQNVLSVKGLYAPTYVSSNFSLEMRMFGEKFPRKHTNGTFLK